MKRTKSKAFQKGMKAKARAIRAKRSQPHKADVSQLSEHDRESMSTLPLGNRLEQLAYTLEQFDSSGRGWQNRNAMLDVIKCSRALFLPEPNPTFPVATSKRNDLLDIITNGDNPTEKVKQAIAEGRVVYTPIACFECATQEAAVIACDAINARTDHTDSARLATSNDLPAILKDRVTSTPSASVLPPSNPWEKAQQ